jgi:ABC-type spermidine/putrescine transport system permease subunit II
VRASVYPRAGRLLPLGAFPLVLFLLAMLVAPVCLLVLYSFWQAGFFVVVHNLTDTNYTSIFRESIYWKLILKSLGVGLLCGTLMVVFGFAMAFAMTFRLGRWGPRILVLVMATLLSSYVVRIYAWKTILGTNGLLNEALIRLGLISQPLGFLLYGYFAIVVTLVYVYLPIVVLPIYAGLQDIDPRVLEASRDLGATPAETFRRVTLPLAMPAVRIAFAFAFVLSSSDYITPNLVGGFSGQMVGNVIADQFGGSSNYPQGAALSVALVVGFGVVLGGLALLGRVARVIASRRPRRPRVVARRAPSTLARTIIRVPWSAVATAVLLVYLLAPLIVVTLFSFNDSDVPGIPFRGFTTVWYRQVISEGDFHRVLQTSVTVALAAVALALVIGVPAAFALTRRRFLLSRAVGLGIYGPIVVPGVVIGVALLTAFVYLNVILGVKTTIFAHALLIVPYVVLVMRARLASMDRRIEEAGRDLGSRPSRVLRTVTLPQILPALLGAAILGIAISLDELVVTNFTIGAEATIPTWIFGQMRTGLTPAVNAVAVLLLVVPLTLMGIAATIIRLRSANRLARSLRGAE